MPKKNAPKKPTTKKPAATKASTPSKTDAKRDAALLLLPSSFAEMPDIPVEIAMAEMAALYKLAKKEARTLGRFGIGVKVIEELGAFGKELGERQRAWITQRDHAASPEGKALRDEADTLRSKMLAAGEWALRHDDSALQELARIREGSGLPDTIEDLYQLAGFWTKHASALKETRLSHHDVTRAAALATELHDVAGEEVSNLTIARALELRNRCFWAATAAANEIRQAGRYAFSDQPKVAARFASRYRQALNRRFRRQGNGAVVPPARREAPKAEPS